MREKVVCPSCLKNTRPREKKRGTKIVGERDWARRGRQERGLARKDGRVTRVGAKQQNVSSGRIRGLKGKLRELSFAGVVGEGKTGKKICRDRFRLRFRGSPPGTHRSDGLEVRERYFERCRTRDDCRATHLRPHRLHRGKKDLGG